MRRFLPGYRSSNDYTETQIVMIQAAAECGKGWTWFVDDDGLGYVREPGDEIAFEDVTEAMVASLDDDGFLDPGRIVWYARRYPEHGNDLARFALAWWFTSDLPCAA